LITISMQKAGKFFGEQELLRDITFELKDNDRVGLVGKNGSGKTTLLKMIAGELPMDSGSLAIAKNKKLGILHQLPEYTKNATVKDVLYTAFAELTTLAEQLKDTEEALKKEQTRELLAEYQSRQTRFEVLGGYHMDVEYQKVTKGLGITEEEAAREFSTLSGGEKTRINLARLLLEKSDILLLDEPTNHLDIESILWLEEFLQSFKGSVLIISHDRTFLDRTVSCIFELSGKTLSVYPGNYSYYVQEREQLMRLREKEFAAYERRKKELQDAATRLHQWGQAALHKRAFSIEKRIERMASVQRIKQDKRISANFQDARETGQDVLTVKNLSFGYRSENPLITDLQFLLKKGDAMGVLGKNGCGKTTLLQLLLGMISPKTGTIRLGTNCKIGYLPQVVSFENPREDVLQTAVYTLDMGEGEARNYLGKFRFVGEDVYKPIDVLSGGEKSRLRLAFLMRQEINLLILDEPTNHLDILSREWIEEILDEYTGTMLFVSHDRYFIDRFATRILALLEGGYQDYPDTYENFLRFQKTREAAPLQKQEAEKVPPVKKANTYLQQKEQKRREQKARELEKSIEEREEALAALDEEIQAEATNPEALLRLTAEREHAAAGIDALYAEYDACFSDES